MRVIGEEHITDKIGMLGLVLLFPYNRYALISSMFPFYLFPPFGLPFVNNVLLFWLHSKQQILLVNLRSIR